MSVVSSLGVTELKLSLYRKDDKGRQRPQHGNCLHCCKDFCKKEHNDLFSTSVLKGPEERLKWNREDWLEIFG